VIVEYAKYLFDLYISWIS